MQAIIVQRFEHHAILQVKERKCQVSLSSIEELPDGSKRLRAGTHIEYVFPPAQREPAAVIEVPEEFALRLDEMA